MANKKIVNEISSVVYSLPWFVARDEGFFDAEGLDVEFLKARGGNPKSGSEDTSSVNPIISHVPFEEGEVKVFRACEEGNVRRAYDLDKAKVEGFDVRIASLQPSRPLHALVSAPGSKFDRPAQLTGEGIGVNFFAGSHFAAIRLLEGFVGKGNFKLQHFGGPADRLAAVLRGEVAAAVIMEPYVTLAETLGANILAQGFFVATDVVREDLEQEDLVKLYRALNKASDFLNASAENKRKYIPYLLQDIPDDYEWGKPAVEDFHLPHLRFGHTGPYPRNEFERSRDILIDYDLIDVSASFDAVVDNRSAEAVAA